MAVTVHEVVGLEEEGPIVTSKPTQRDGSCVCFLNDVSLMGLETLREDFKAYRVLPQQSYCLMSFSGGADACRAIVSTMVRAGAFPGKARYVQREHMSHPHKLIADQLVREGLLEAHAAGLALTDAAVPRLMCGLHLELVGNVGAIRGLALEDCTVCELCDLMARSEWVWMPLPRLKRQRLALFYQPGEEKL